MGKQVVSGGDDVIEVDDRLTLFTVPENVPKIGQFFEARRGLIK